ncbi:MAG TPA: hypothetical protein VMH02_09035 [Verrucomicrobiae bacterium]|nr:hypothetical protein [Verrucomicrobiae bacterium]
MDDRDERTGEEIEERIYTIEMRQASFDRFKAAVEIVAIVLAGAWAFYQFIYEDKIKPFMQTPSLTVTTTLEKLGTRRGWQAVRATCTVLNDSKIRVSILARTDTLVGSSVVASPLRGGFVLKDGTWNVNRSYHLSKPAFLQSHSMFFSGDARSANRRLWLEPGDTFTQTNVYFVPIAKYDVLRYDVNFQYTKYDVVPPFAQFTAPSGDHVLRPVRFCVDYDESPQCPVTGVGATSFLSLW